MAIEVGQQLLHYRLIEKIGEGGMGVVWKAVDTTLDRGVAIKILPDSFAEDAERLVRFEREAKLLASLNHPNIATIHGLQQHPSTSSGRGGVRFLVMELVDGQDLAQRLSTGAMPMEDALPVAAQLAEALECAHEQGVIHRDLKPANIKLTPDSKVKVLDFGLAKAIEPPRGVSDSMMSPTMTSAGTVAGMILGTAAYMSPEQAKAKTVDRRADIWAFGVVLWEMLSGRTLFKGDSVSETLAGVLMADVSLDDLPANTPPRIRRLIERCLRRDPSSRLRDIGDARVVIEESLAAHEWTADFTAQAAEAPTQKPRPRIAVAMMLVALGLAAGAVLTALLKGGPTAPSTEVTKVAIPLAPTIRAQSVRLTPDGRTVIYNGIDVDPQAPDHRNRLYVRRLDEDRTVTVPGSEGVITSALSPDGGWIAFLAPLSQRSSRRQLMKVAIDLAAPPVKIADWPIDAGFSLLWPQPETIFGIRDDGALLPFEADGSGPGEPLKHPDAQANISPPVALPGGRHALFHAASFESGEYVQNAGVLDLETGEQRELIDHASFPVYASSGHLVFSRGETLLAAPFDLERLEVTGGAQSVSDGLWSLGLWTGGSVSISASGDLLYPAGGVQGHSRYLALVTRDGDSTTWSQDRLAFNNISVSPDGRRVAVQVDNIGEGDALLQIRVSDFDRPRFATVGAVPGKDCGSAAWSPSSQLLAYECSDRQVGELYVTTVEGTRSTAPLLRIQIPTNMRAVGFSADDSHAYVHRQLEGGANEVVAVALEGQGDPDQAGQVIAAEEERWTWMSISPDGGFVAYVSDESGRRAIFVRRFESDTTLGPRILAASDAIRPTWGKNVSDGRYELLFARETRTFSMDFTTRPTPRFSEPREHAIDPFVLGLQDAATLPDGRFMIIRAPDTEVGASELRLVLGWTQELARRVQ
jgi:serine/threonine-protein kinase